MCACHGFEQGAYRYLYRDVTANRLHGLTGYRWEAQARSNQVPLYGCTALVWRWWCFPLRVSGMPELVVALEKRVQRGCGDARRGVEYRARRTHSRIYHHAQDARHWQLSPADGHADGHVPRRALTTVAPPALPCDTHCHTYTRTRASPTRHSMNPSQGFPTSLAPAGSPAIPCDVAT
jgi:hypothetical protein